MLWSVDSGGGYPYPNGTDVAKYVSTADFKLMDTNGNGIITQDDDMYAPYYPVSISSTGEADSGKTCWIHIVVTVIYHSCQHLL